MNALRNAHRALRPGGIMLDVHPEPGDPTVEVVRGRAVVGAVRRDESWRTAQVGRVHAALDALVAEGLYVREVARSFDFMQRADRLDDWIAHLAAKGMSPLGEDLVARLRALTAGGESLRTRERVTASRLRRRE